MKKVSYAVQAVDGAVRAITNSRSRLAECRDRLQAIRSQLVRIIKDVCPEPVGEPYSYKEYSMTCAVDSVFCEPSINIYIHNLDSFKDSRLLNVLEYLDNLGNSKTDTRDWAQCLSRTFRFKYDGFMVRVDATVKSDSPTCRKVVVSSEMVKQDVYAIQCD